MCTDPDWQLPGLKALEKIMNFLKCSAHSKPACVQAETDEIFHQIWHKPSTSAPKKCPTDAPARGPTLQPTTATIGDPKQLWFERRK